MNPTRIVLTLILLWTGLGAVTSAAERKREGNIRAVLVHGSGVAHPFIVHEPPTAPACIWAFTYNVRDGGQFEPPTPDTKFVMLSFFTEEEWTALVVEGGMDPARLEPTHAQRYHTRIILASEEAPVYAQHRRAAWPGPFTEGYTLTKLGEDYLGSFGIPTHLDSDERPSLVRVATTERNRLRILYGAPDGVCDASESWALGESIHVKNLPENQALWPEN